jgi:hypothetical protein
MAYKLQSISIAGADQAISFALCLKRTLPQHRRVLHLLIKNDTIVQPIITPSVQPPNSPIARAVTKAVEALPGVKWRKKYKFLQKNVGLNVQCMQTNRRRDESIFTAFLQILHLTAHTLQTLNVDFDSGWKIVPAQLDAGVFVPRIRSMPALSSLTVAYYALFHSEVDESLFLEDETTGGEERALLPRLRHLDLAGFRVPSHPLDLYERIARLSPTLTHLRLPMSLASGLEAALELGPGPSSEEDEEHVSDTVHTDSGSDADTVVDAGSSIKEHPRTLPLTIQRVYIQLSPPAGHFCRCGSWRHHAQELGRYSLEVERFRELEKRDGRVVVLGVENAKTDFEEIVSRGWDEVGGSDE